MRTVLTFNWNNEGLERFADFFAQIVEGLIMNKNQNYLYIFVSALTIGTGSYVCSTDVLADTDSPIAQVANTNSQIDNLTDVGKTAFDTPNVQTNAKNQVQQMASPNALTSQPATAASGQVEDVTYSIDNGVLTLSGGTLKSSTVHDYPWRADNTITDIRITGTLKLEGDTASSLFWGMSNLKSIAGMDKLDTSKATSMSWMFAGDSGLTSLDLSKFDTSKVTNMKSMFDGDFGLTNLDVSNFDTSKVTNMTEMFLNNSKLTSLDLSKFDTSKVTNMNRMFSDASSLTSLDLSNFDTSEVTNMYGMFSQNRSLTNLDVSNFDTSKVTNMSNMFAQDSRLTSLDVSNFDTSKVTNMSSMFQSNSKLTSLDVSNFNTANVTNMSYMFFVNSSLTSLDVSKFDTAKVTNMSYMLSGNSSLTSLDVSNFNTAKVTNMQSMLSLNTGLTNLDVTNFNTSNVTNMDSMFSGDINLTSLDVSKFDTANVRTMESMFSMPFDSSKLTSIDVSKFDTAKVENMYRMFSNNADLTSLDLSNFDTAKVKSADFMFASDEKLWILKLGPKTFHSSFGYKALTEHSSNSKIPNSNPIRYASGPGWQAVAGGTVDSPRGPVYDGLLTNRPTEAEIYVWEQKPAADQYTLKVNKTQDLYEGQSWDPASAITAATKNGESNKSSVTITDQDGKPVTQETVAALKSGSYPLTYKNGDQTGTLNLTITADTTSLKTTDIDLYLNKTFTDADLREKIEAKDSDGLSLNYQYNIKDVTGKPVAVNDVSAKVGQYTVEIATDKPKNGKDPLKGSLTIKVTDSSTLNLKYATKTITTNQAWQPEDAFDNATDVGGQTLIFKDITVNATDSSGKPVNDLNNLYKNSGTYTVHYTNGAATKELKLTVQTPSNPTNPTNPAKPNRPSTPVTPTTPSGSSSVPSTTSGGGSNASSNTPAGSPSNSSNNANLPRYAAAKGTVVYSIKKIGLYKTTDFTKSTRRSWYAKKPRINRPMFVVTGYKRAANGVLRYQVRDVNHTSKTDGQKGYITASQKYVRPVYYASKHATITVINPRGVNAYRKANLTGKVKNYRQGTVLRVKGIVKHNLTTRYVLTNGDYITANRKLVNMGRHKQVKSIKTKQSINRYSNVNLTKKNQSIAKNRTLKVYGYDYSRRNNVTKHGTLRYRVAGGYITANTKYVQVIDRG
ncbi:BspA family leucine-rich repeat surface protein [Lentilactobacillus hilgardii]|uniref:BspA family leucine-rich repeat surface protein n=1 Tax=Lentilactobacillus hilgardii TaxID=1588 RepID=A0A6P1E3Z5_LENHI|nr:BspA family leucine-rich repeat surface protein [Lentilactobacillus hilgardii]MCT3393100.1 BspA family leucine-rich repeat surface protein [Lentilactobacillus hilgardii]QHB51368.1 BspA family leucine-rich repeat surface protein [Lentilactobacillus hilgardii]